MKQAEDYSTWQAGPFHHKVGGVCTTEARGALLTPPLRALLAASLCYIAPGWPQQLLVLLSGLTGRPTQQAQLTILQICWPEWHALAEGQAACTRAAKAVHACENVQLVLH